MADDLVLVSDLIVLLQEIQLLASQVVVFKGLHVSPDRMRNPANGDVTALLDCVFHGSIRAEGFLVSCGAPPVLINGVVDVIG